jgi:hypothetical protein
MAFGVPRLVRGDADDTTLMKVRPNLTPYLSSDNNYQLYGHINAPSWHRNLVTILRNGSS